MNEKRNIEQMLSDEAREATARHLNPSENERQKRIQELLGQHQIVMGQYEELEDKGADESITSPLLDKASAILVEINALDPKIKGQTAKTFDQAEYEAELHKLNLEDLDDTNPKNLN